MSLRIVAASVLVVWLVAMVACLHNCANGSCAGTSQEVAKASCHDSGGDSDASPSGESRTSCISKKPIDTERQVVGAAVPEFFVAWISSPVEAISALTCDESPHEIRQHSRPDRVLTPEVSLGPAFRSLAPPALT